MIETLFYFRELEHINRLPDDCIFVFGSNCKGIHGSGSALSAKLYFGAELGHGEGRCKQSYALPTKATPSLSLTLEEIQVKVDRFLNYARHQELLHFVITAVGTNLAGYTHQQIAPLFSNLADNCCVPSVWLEYIPHQKAIDVTDYIFSIQHQSNGVTQ